MGQIWPTDVQYQFLNGIYAGNYGNLHITSDGDIDTIKGSAYDWPDSIRVADAGKRYYLTGVYSGGQYDMDWRRPSKADVSDLVENQFVFGGSDGSISQSEYVLFAMYAGFGDMNKRLSMGNAQAFWNRFQTGHILKVTGFCQVE